MVKTMKNLSKSRVLILGLGNLLLQDEGVGLRVLQELRETYIWPDNVVLLDGGVLGLELLPYLEDADYALILDAVRSGKAAGTIVRLVNENIPTGIALKYSAHQVNFQETLAMAYFRGTLPQQLVLLGVEPARLALSTVLTPVVLAQLPLLVDAAVQQLFAWGITPIRRTFNKPTVLGNKEKHGYIENKILNTITSS